MKTWRNGTWKASLFIRPDYVMPSLLAFLLPTKGERFSRLAVDSFNAITDRTVSTDWMGRVPASVADLEEACRTQQASDKICLYIRDGVLLISSSPKMIWIGRPFYSSKSCDLDYFPGFNSDVRVFVCRFLLSSCVCPHSADSGVVTSVSFAVFIFADNV